ncbi:aldehyde dehydrogenase family protein [Conexibacter stalactiti]|uniref:Aldehyde dehydrogenase family protein n=1 Tax=Conexibacter stalactiti TaxID=1940611 RepID=A0ABU4HML8_9ACTN|nr:aldehyde dehydrogenase family protein [Conexibacter stalactiti]MDW5594556.1 aldehyde dehydrogenase family protein [Conexibacter stalactiti]MEC5035198.1 aldehyde dehydrogenase family protein [Conexibacter stalactiti]
MLTTSIVYDPLEREQLGEVALTDPAAVQGIVDAARAAQDGWARTTLAERADRLEAAADALRPEATALGELLARESGKPLAQAQFEVRASIGLLADNARVGRRWEGRVLPTEGLGGTAQDLAYTRREPLGVVGAILPFNFPVELFVEKAAAGLVGGNAVVSKAPPEAPLVVERFQRALVEAGIPAAVTPLLHGDRDVGVALSQARGLDAISLTGSTAAGIAVAQAGAPTLRRLHLELGGNNAAVVLADADLDLVAEELAYGRLLMNGQACSASKRILVHPSLHDELVERLAAVVDRQVLGAPADPATTIGPLVNAAAARRVRQQVERAVAQGATPVRGGDDDREAALLPPALLADVPAAAAVATDDEIFGPVFVLVRADGPQQAIALANASSFGLMASVFSRDVQLALAVAERLEAGGVVINGTDNYRPPVIPFGGVKLSGSGREGLGYTIDELTREKTIVLRRFRRDLPDEEGVGG